MKNWIGTVTILMLVFASMAQAPGELKGLEKAADGGYVVTGIDPFGADVTVVYNEAMMKTYQERTLNGETVFARFTEGALTDYGIYTKPVAARTANELLFSSKDE